MCVSLSLVRLTPRLTRTDVKKVEGRIPYDFGKDAVEVPGARALLASLDKVGAPWMIGEQPIA